MNPNVRLISPFRQRNAKSISHSDSFDEWKIDFAVQTEKRVIPIESKAEENVKSKSLKTYINQHPNLKGLRVSMLNYVDQGWMENLPLYAIEGYLRAEGLLVSDNLV